MKEVNRYSCRHSTVKVKQEMVIHLFCSILDKIYIGRCNLETNYPHLAELNKTVFDTI